jgi:hypothetical protein
MSSCSRVKYPYPKPSYCDVPSEDKTGELLCRPLPQSAFPVPPVLPKLIGITHRLVSFPHVFCNLICSSWICGMLCS